MRAWSRCLSCSCCGWPATWSARAIRGLPATLREAALAESTLRLVYRSALESRLSVWTQAEAMDLLGEMSTASFETALGLHFDRALDGDAFFVRARLVPLLFHHLPDVERRTDFMRRAASDPSPTVRQAVAAALQQLPRETACALLEQLLDDPERSVRASALTQLPVLAEAGRALRFAELLEARTADGEDPGVIRLALEMLPDVYAALDDPGAQAFWLERATALCRELHATAPATRVRRWAAQAGEALWLASDARRTALYEELAEALAALPRGGRRRLPVDLLDGIEIEDLGRVLALLALTDHGFDVEFTRRHLHVVRGHRFGTRLWRVVHEFLNSATDKRQGHRHTIGRHFDGTLVVPSTILCEQAATKVPGEPRHIEEEDGWRPFLPLLDNAFAALDRGHPIDTVRIVTTEGVTELEPPRGLVARLRARWHLVRDYPALAERRNWEESDSSAPGHFAERLQALGFRLRFRPHAWQRNEVRPNGDERVRRFFPATHAALGLPAVSEIAARAESYFYSLYQNTLGHLSLFLVGVCSIFLGQHLAAQLRIGAARRSIALVIGGWGTRGKSGTERLKAGLFNGLGYPLVSKTTGCEAMFIFARSFGQAREMFLFRPYDKATIWEQANLLEVSRGLGAQVFLWECMALTPSYVEILQRQWMRDDYATITNAYPDHEDIQGPAGIDIPAVIGRFIPRDSTVLTTEEFMLPILRNEARRVGSRMFEIGWREALQLAPDVQARFPYDEHPYNIVLVTALARILGIEEDFTLKEMADRVIPDLGVLKTFPEAEVEDRRIQFTNGMSANERFGCLGNWRRMGFDVQDPVSDPGVWVSTVVNNRADRVARSKVFASILVADLSADRHVLIGTNLDGLLSYVDEAWDAEFGEFTLAAGDDVRARRAELERWFRRFRVPWTPEQVRARVLAMAHGLGVEGAVADGGEAIDATAVEALATHLGGERAERGEALAQWHAIFAAQCEAAQALLTRAADATVPDTILATGLVAQLRTWFDAKLVVVKDAGASGEQVVETIVRATPPALRNRVMGMQNIKGTGLDFAYRWLAWESAHAACEGLAAADVREREVALQTLVSFQEFGWLSERRVRRALADAGADTAMQKEATRAQLATIEATLDARLEALRAGPARRRRRNRTAGAGARPWRRSSIPSTPCAGADAPTASTGT